MGHFARWSGEFTKPNIEHHRFEDYLAKTYMQEFLGLLTRRNGDGRCYLEEVFESYDRPDLNLRQRLKFAVPHRAIEVFRTRAGVNKEILKAKVFHHHPTVRALVNTARSIAKFGLTVPQRFSAPLILVWNYTQACNLTRKHCYQEAGHKPLADELTTDQKDQTGGRDGRGVRPLPRLCRRRTAGFEGSLDGD